MDTHRRAAWLLGLIAPWVLAGCGGGPDPSVLADGSRAIYGASTEAADALEVPVRIRGASSVEDFLVQSAKVAMATDESTFGPCEARHVAGRSDRFDPFEAPVLDVFARNGAQRAWMTHLYVGGCGDPRRHNLVIVTFEDQPASFIGLLPGDTRAGTQLQRLATTRAYEAAAQTAGFDCRRADAARIRATRFEGLVATDRRENAGAVWQERWTAHYCGTDYDVSLVFAPALDGSGAMDVEAVGAARTILEGWPSLE